MDWISELCSGVHIEAQNWNIVRMAFGLKYGGLTSKSGWNFSTVCLISLISELLKISRGTFNPSFRRTYL
jgi:hypothetical protein